LGIIASAATLFLYWMCHVIWFRVAWPRSPLRSLLGLLIGGAVVYCVLVLWLASLRPLWIIQVLGESPYFWLGLLMYVVSVLAYIVVYSGVEVESPSLRIILFIAEGPGGAMSYETLLGLFNNERVILPRLDDMVRSGLIVTRNGKYVLTPPGERLATIFRFYRGLLGRGMGG
jgi:hypothetical protein